MEKEDFLILEDISSTGKKAKVCCYLRSQVARWKFKIFVTQLQ